MHSFRRRPIDINKKLPVVRSNKEVNFDQDFGTNQDGTAVVGNVEAFVVRARSRALCLPVWPLCARAPRRSRARLIDHAVAEQARVQVGELAHAEAVARRPRLEAVPRAVHVRQQPGQPGGAHRCFAHLATGQPVRARARWHPGTGVVQPFSNSKG